MDRFLASSAVSVCLLFSSLVACGNRAEPASPSTPPGDSTTTATTTPASSSSPAASAEPAVEPKKRKPFEVYSACTDVATLVFGDDPKSAASGKRTIAPSSSIEGPRDANGNQTVWLLDNAGEPIVKVQVTRGMKRVEVGRSCRTLDAR
jgi:hypothetical protein